MSLRHLAGPLALLLLAAPAHAQTVPSQVPEEEVLQSVDAARAFADDLREALEHNGRIVQGAGEALLSSSLQHLGPLGQFVQTLASTYAGAAREVAERGAPGTCAELAAARPSLDPQGTWAGAAEACADLAAEVQDSFSDLPGGFP